MILIDARPESGTTILGELSKVFIINNSILRQIIVNPTTGSTTYDFNLVDVNGKNVFQETNCSGEFNQIVNLPIYGNTTLNIVNSSIDEVYNIILVFQRA
jgi:hypothetical protein